MTRSISAIVDKIFDEFGGPDKFAQSIVADYLAAPTNSNQRVRIASLIVTLLKYLPQDSKLHEDMDPAAIRARLRKLVPDFFKEDDSSATGTE